MPKRYLSILIALIVSLSMLTACSQNDSQSSSQSNTSVAGAQIDASNSAIDESIYSEVDNWAYLAQGEDKEADLFILCPTVFSGDNNNHNMSLSDTDSKESFLGALNMEKGIYEDNCRMFAPYYRQAGLDVYEMTAEEREPYLESAYQDVKEAFIYYMENYNDGRPYILAGFSQGADMCIRLVKDLFDEAKYANNNVAVYAIGWGITEEEVQEYPHLKLAQGETDTGVVITFNTEAEDVQSSVIVEDSTLGINPLNWKTDSTYADKSLNLGACFTNYDGEIVKEVENLTGAYLDPERGTLKVTDINKEEYPASLSIFPEGVYHIYDYQFFYRNLQKNVGDRLNAFLNT